MHKVALFDHPLLLFYLQGWCSLQHQLWFFFVCNVSHLSSLLLLLSCLCRRAPAASSALYQKQSSLFFGQGAWVEFFCFVECPLSSHSTCQFSKRSAQSLSHPLSRSCVVCNSFQPKKRDSILLKGSLLLCTLSHVALLLLIPLPHGVFLLYMGVCSQGHTGEENWCASFIAGSGCTRGIGNRSGGTACIRPKRTCRGMQSFSVSLCLSLFLSLLQSRNPNAIPLFLSPFLSLLHILPTYGIIDWKAPLRLGDLGKQLRNWGSECFCECINTWNHLRWHDRFFKHSSIRRTIVPVVFSNFCHSSLVLQRRF